ncbi:MAG: hypothetical protein ACR2PT_15690 [Endozoicomonas sp.]
MDRYRCLVGLSVLLLGGCGGALSVECQNDKDGALLFSWTPGLDVVDIAAMPTFSAWSGAYQRHEKYVEASRQGWFVSWSQGTVNCENRAQMRRQDQQFNDCIAAGENSEFCQSRYPGLRCEGHKVVRKWTAMKYDGSRVDYWYDLTPRSDGLAIRREDASRNPDKVFRPCGFSLFGRLKQLLMIAFSV